MYKYLYLYAVEGKAIVRCDDFITLFVLIVGLFFCYFFVFLSWPSEIIFSIFIARNVLAAASKKTITKILKRGVIVVYYEK